MVRRVHMHKTYKHEFSVNEREKERINMIMTSLVVELFNTNFIQRWNDKLRPVNLTELDYC